jgi:hypothetical protein
MATTAAGITAVVEDIVPPVTGVVMAVGALTGPVTVFGMTGGTVVKSGVIDCHLMPILGNVTI